MLKQKVLMQVSIIISSILICCCVHAAPKKSNTKTVIIIHGTFGIGKEIALTFQRNNWDVWATCDSTDNCNQIPGINVEQLNSNNEKSAKLLVQKIKNKSNRIDVIVNNAAFNIVGPEEAISVAQAQEMFNVNIITPLSLIQESLPLMRTNNSGRIINISNTPGTRAVPGLGLYTASQMALEGLSEALASELSPWNIRVSIIETGSVDNKWATNSPSAANIDSHPGYKNFTQKLRSDLTKKSSDRKNQEQQIAKLVVQIVNTEKPNMRYQADVTAVSLLSELFNDPTGNTNRDKKISLSKDLYELPSTF